MKRSEQDELLNEVLHGDEPSDFRQASLENGLSFIRQRQRRRRFVRAGVLAAAPLLAVLAMLVTRTTKAPNIKIASVAAPAPLISQPAAQSGGVKFISDDELLGLFPNRSVGLIKKDGRQELVFFDKDESKPEQ